MRLMEVDALGSRRLRNCKCLFTLLFTCIVFDTTKLNVSIFSPHISLTLYAFNIFKLNVFGRPTIFNLDVFKLNVFDVYSHSASDVEINEFKCIEIKY